MKSKADYPIIGDFLQLHWVYVAIAIFGIVFDLLIVPALLWKPSRKIAFIVSVFFHLFNSIVFQIGIFPYMSLAFSVFFFPPETIRNIFFKNSRLYEGETVKTPLVKKWISVIFVLYICIQILLPIRHHFIKDNVLWTEEGHRMSWRMMLRSRSGIIEFNVFNKKNKVWKTIKLEDYLTEKQRLKVAAYPDFIWQFSQHLKKEYAENNQDISVFVNSKISINGKSYRQYINPKIDLANEVWNPYSHHKWILPSEY